MAEEHDEYWRKKLVVKNIPCDWSADMIKNFLEVVTEADVEDSGVDYFWEWISKAQQQIQETRQPLRLKMIGEAPTSILVRDLVPNLSRDHLFYYFDSPKSGGIEESVLDDGCELFPGLKMAVITFSSHDVAKNVLAVQEHQICEGVRVRVEPCYDEFHKPLLQELAHLSTGPAPSQAKAAGSAKSGTLVQHAQSTPTVLGGPQNSMENGTRRSVDESHYSEVRGQKENSEHIGLLTVRGQGTEDQQWRDLSNSAETETQFALDKIRASRCGVYSGYPPPRTHHTTRQGAGHNHFPLQSFTSQEYQSFEIDGGDFHDRVLYSELPAYEIYGYSHTSTERSSSTDQQMDQFYLHSASDESEDDGLRKPESRASATMMERGSDLQMHLRESEVAAGLRKPESRASATMMERCSDLQMHERESEHPEERTKTQLQSQTAEHLSVPTYKLKILKQCVADFQGCQVTFLEQQGMILFSGTKDDCSNVKQIFLIQSQELAENRRSVPSSISTILQTPQGQRYLDEVNQQYLRCSIEVQESTIICAGLDMREVNSLLEDIVGNIRREICEVPTTLSGSPELLTVKTGLESELMVLLTLPTAGSNKLLVDGINGDVDKAKRELQEHVKNNKLGRKTFKVTGAMADRAVKQWYSKQLEEAKALILCLFLTDMIHNDQRAQGTVAIQGIGQLNLHVLVIINPIMVDLMSSASTPPLSATP
ncbi:hypothetical protein BaRGS_00021817 [Batillaria attramentaria]|uniref:RRM domain-containing protein n=1 Tax=Batillaria attramentaria TaxID=370345 RepID=A0ABD0KIG0_9CAEN